jgi:hypothetical protein
VGVPIGVGDPCIEHDVTGEYVERSGVGKPLPGRRGSCALKCRPYVSQRMSWAVSSTPRLMNVSRATFQQHSPFLEIVELGTEVE